MKKFNHILTSCALAFLIGIFAGCSKSEEDIAKEKKIAEIEQSVIEMTDPSNRGIDISLNGRIVKLDRIRYILQANCSMDDQDSSAGETLYTAVNLKFQCTGFDNEWMYYDGHVVRDMRGQELKYIKVLNIQPIYEIKQQNDSFEEPILWVMHFYFTE